MGADRDNAIRRIVQQSLADVRLIEDALMDFEPEDAVHLAHGYCSPLQNSNADASLAFHASGSLDLGERPKLLLDMIRQRVAALPVEPAE